ncbi:MAG: LysR substrate-binding domain-containing protein [Pseudomonadota bacterium]
MGRFEELENFVHIVEAGGISAASDRQNVAKSAVSKRLRQLESRLSAELLTRTTRRLRLTDIGERVHAEAVRLIQDHRTLDDMARAAQTELRGPVRIAVPLSFGLRHVTPALNTFLQRHPELSVQADFSDRRVDLVGEGYDLALRIGELEDSSLRARRLATVRGVVVSSPAYLGHAGVPTTPAELSTHHCVRYNAGIRGRWPYTGPDGERGVVRVDGRIQSNNGDYLRDCIVSGFGIGLLPEFFLQEELRAGTLVACLEEYEWLSAGLYALFPHSLRMPLRVRALVDYLAEAFTRFNAQAPPGRDGDGA